jgi:pimeloyl-ACP methyl ester carboxylesterase
MRARWMVLLLVVAGIAWAWGTGRVERMAMAIRILDELRRPGPASWLRGATRAPSRTSTVLEAPRLRLAADVYRPGGRAGRVPVILVPGMVEGGKDDPRVRPFAELLARAGFLVVTPDLPSFRTLRVHRDNERDLAAALDAVTARPDLAPEGRAGLFGISYAGGIALLVAIDSSRAARIPFVATVGAYADLDTAVRFLATGQMVHRGRQRPVEPDPYGQLVLIRTYEEFLEDPGDSPVFDAMVARRVRDPGAALSDLADSLSPQSRVIYDLFESATPDRVPGLMARLPSGMRQRMADLSPGRRDFAALRARLYLVHDLDDGTFPASESRRLAALARPHRPTRLVVIEALHHVVPEPWRSDPWGFLTRDLPEAARLAGWWYAILGEAGRR